jgi:hypothetical protein
MRRALVVITLSAVAVIGCSIWFIEKYFGIEAHAVAVWLWPPSTVDQIEARHLHTIAGWFSVNCGHVRHREDADHAIACEQGALKSGHRFYVEFDYVGLDSHGISGLARNSEGEVYEVVTDDLGRGAFGAVSRHVRNVTVTRCEATPTEQTSNAANRYLTCFPE